MTTKSEFHTQKESVASKLTILKFRFWDLLIQKLFRNVASLKFQLLMLMYIMVWHGMFDGQWINGAWVAKISPTVGCGLMGGGFVTLALGRIVVNKLTENDKDETLSADEALSSSEYLDTDR